MKTLLASFLRSSLPSLAPSSIAAGAFAAVVAATGCTVNAVGGPGSSPGADFSGDLPSRPLAAGATTTESITVASASQAVRTIKSSDPSIVSVGPLDTSDLPALSYNVAVTGGNPGTATLTIYDASGSAVDHLDVQVAPTTVIQLGDPGGETILTGQTYAMHSTTIGQGGVTLVGDGAIHYSYAGSLAAAPAGGSICDGDCAYFEAASPGDGQVMFSASASTATAAATFHAVEPSTVDAVSLPQTGVALSLSSSAGSASAVSYTLSASGSVVHGAGLQCTSSNPNTAQVVVDLFGVPISGATTGTIAVAAVAAGSATITCTFNGIQRSFPVTVK